MKLSDIIALVTGAINWWRVGAIATAAAAAIAAGVYFETLREDAAELAALKPKISGLATSLGCAARPPAERDLFACVSARDRDAAAAHAAALKKQQEAAAAAADQLAERIADLQVQVTDADASIDAATAADDGPLPKVMLDNWARERARREKKK